MKKDKPSGRYACPVCHRPSIDPFNAANCCRRAVLVLYKCEPHNVEYTQDWHCVKCAFPERQKK